MARYNKDLFMKVTEELLLQGKSHMEITVELDCTKNDVIRASSQLEIIHAGDTQYFEKIKAAQMA
jgi:hypothetical protein